MTTAILYWNKPFLVVQKKDRYTGNDQNFHHKKYRSGINRFTTDVSNPVTEYAASEIPIEELKTRIQLREFLESTLPNLTGTFYLMTRCYYRHPAPQRNPKKKKLRTRKRGGRPMYTREWQLKKYKHYTGRPRQRVTQGLNYVLKFDMVNGQVTNFHERKTKSKRPPYIRKKYELLRKIKDNAKGKKSFEYS